MQYLEDAGAVILVLLVVVLVHEGGHFLVGKLSGIRVDEFAVGFGPKLASKRWGETEYSLRLLPAGGFVRMAGMLGLEGEADAGERNFYRASIPRRLATILAGVATNFLLAGVIFSIDAMASVSPEVQPGGPAATAGMRNGDSITRIGDTAIPVGTSSEVDVVHRATAATQGRPTMVSFTRGNQTLSATITPLLVITNGVSPPTGATVTAVTQLPVGTAFAVTAVNDAPVGTGDPAALLAKGGAVSGHVITTDGSAGTAYTNISAKGIVDGLGAPGHVEASWRLGVVLGTPGTPFPQSLGSGFGQIPSFIGSTATGIANLVTNPNSGGLNGPQGLSGPVGIVRETATVTQQGGRSLIEWIAFISMNLGLINLLPIPFLDGGKATFILLEAVRRKRLDPRHEALAYAVGLALVVVFAIYVTIGDVSRPQ